MPLLVSKGNADGMGKYMEVLGTGLAHSKLKNICCYYYYCNSDIFSDRLSWLYSFVPKKGRKRVESFRSTSALNYVASLCALPRISHKTPHVSLREHLLPSDRVISMPTLIKMDVGMPTQSSVLSLSQLQNIILIRTLNLQRIFTLMTQCFHL